MINEWRTFVLYVRVFVSVREASASRVWTRIERKSMALLNATYAAVCVCTIYRWIGTYKVALLLKNKRNRMNENQP